jgi:hypothetical protein
MMHLVVILHTARDEDLIEHGVEDDREGDTLHAHDALTPVHLQLCGCDERNTLLLLLLYGTTLVVGATLLLQGELHALLLLVLAQLQELHVVLALYWVIAEAVIAYVLELPHVLGDAIKVEVLDVLGFAHCLSSLLAYVHPRPPYFLYPALVVLTEFGVPIRLCDLLLIHVVENTRIPEENLLPLDGVIEDPPCL